LKFVAQQAPAAAKPAAQPAAKQAPAKPAGWWIVELNLV